MSISNICVCRCQSVFSCWFIIIWNTKACENIQACGNWKAFFLCNSSDVKLDERCVSFSWICRCFRETSNALKEEAKVSCGLWSNSGACKGPWPFKQGQLHQEQQRQQRGHEGQALERALPPVEGGEEAVSQPSGRRGHVVGRRVHPAGVSAWWSRSRSWARSAL